MTLALFVIWVIFVAQYILNLLREHIARRDARRLTDRARVLRYHQQQLPTSVGKKES